MATAQAAGIPSPSVANMTAYIASPQAPPRRVPCPRIAATATVSANSARKATPTKASHLICWRSSPRRLRKRVTSDAPARIAASRAAIPVTSLRAGDHAAGPGDAGGVDHPDGGELRKRARHPPGREGEQERGHGRRRRRPATAPAASAGTGPGRRGRAGTAGSGWTGWARSPSGRSSAAARPNGSEPGAVTQRVGGVIAGQERECRPERDGQQQPADHVAPLPRRRSASRRSWSRPRRR